MAVSSLNATLDSIFNLPPKFRRRFRRFVARPRKKRRVEPHSREALLDYMRKNNIRSPRILESFRTEGDPIPHSYRKEFGSWKAATREAFGNPVVKPELDKIYIAKCALWMKVDNYRKYLDARKRNSDIIPSIYHVIRLFGSFRDFMVVVKGAEFKSALEAYGVLWRKLGKAPTLNDCMRAGVVLEALTKPVFKTKKALDEWIEVGEEIWRKRHER